MKEEYIEEGIINGFEDSNKRLIYYCKLGNTDINYLEIDKKNYKYDIKKNSDQIKFYKTIINDINRTFSNNDMLKNEYKEGSVIVFQNKLELLLCNFFLKFKKRIYFQGFNSVSEIIYLNYGIEISFFLLDIVSKIYFDKFMKFNLYEQMNNKITKLKNILKKYNEDIYLIVKNE